MDSSSCEGEILPLCINFGLWLDRTRCEDATACNPFLFTLMLAFSYFQSGQLQALMP
jgi:hypothetical protein